MRNLTFIIAIVLSFSAKIVLCQDLHFSNYDNSPQNLNPALIGDFHGTLRLGGIYRDQFSQFFNAGYQSYGAFLEYNTNAKLLQHDWFSIGASIEEDRAGDLGFGTSRVSLTASYHLPLNEDQTITIGLQGSSINRQSDLNRFQTFNSLSGTTGHGEELANLLQSYSAARMDYNVGLTYLVKINMQTEALLGTSLYHLALSKRNTQGATQDYLPRRLNIHGELRVDYGKGNTFRPRFVYTRSENATLLNLQVLNNLTLKGAEIEFGLGYRIADALQFLVGYQLKEWKINGAFDMTTSSAKLYNNSFGAFELGLHRIIKVPPKAKVKLIQICPRL